MRRSALRHGNGFFKLGRWLRRGRLLRRLRLRYRRSRSSAFRVSCSLSVQALPQQFGNRLINRAGVRLFFSDADVRQHFYNHVRWNLQLPGQLVNADFAHILDCNALVTRRLADFPRISYVIKFFFGSRRILSGFRQ